MPAKAIAKAPPTPSKKRQAGAAAPSASTKRSKVEASSPPPAPARNQRASTTEPSAKRARSRTPGARGGTPGPGGSRARLNGHEPMPFVPKPGMNPFPAPLKPVTKADLESGHAADVSNASTLTAAEGPSSNKAKSDVINRELFVFGSGDMGQHGLGTEVIDEIKRPRLHTWVASRNADGKLGKGGFETIAAGGMHMLAIDSNGVIYTWGINDNASLGRQTTRDPSIEAEVFETEPMPVEGLSPTGTGIVGGPLPEGGKEGPVEKFRATRIAAGDSVSVALNEVGEVRVWGSFRSNDGLLGFDGQVGSARTQFLPVALPALRKHSFSQVACGNDHVVLLATDGNVFTWGNGQQSQLGRRIIERRKVNGLNPERLSLKKIVLVGTGSYHSFAVDHKGEVYGWGLNSLKQIGIDTDEDIIPVPRRVPALSPSVLGNGARVVQIAAGEHYSLFLLSDGRVFGCGRCDGCELGLDEEHPAKKLVAEARAKWEEKREAELKVELAAFQKRMDAKKKESQGAKGGAEDGFGGVVSEGDMPPTRGPPPDEFVPEAVHIPFPSPPSDAPSGSKTSDGSTRIVSLACGARHNLAVAADGRVFSWGFGVSSQLGQGDEEQMETPQVIKSRAFHGFKAVAATAGGQHSAVLAVKDDRVPPLAPK